MVLRARWEGIHQKVDIIAGRVEILAADCHGGRGRDTAGPDFREPSALGISLNSGNPPLTLLARVLLLLYQLLLQLKSYKVLDLLVDAPPPGKPYLEGNRLETSRRKEKR
jgi:hypothetical protein